MKLMLDLMGKRYGKLPSEVLKSGDTIDMIICTTALEYEQWREKKQKNNTVPTHHSQAELQKRIDQANEISGQK